MVSGKNTPLGIHTNKYTTFAISKTNTLLSAVSAITNNNHDCKTNTLILGMTHCIALKAVEGQKVYSRKYFWPLMENFWKNEIQSKLHRQYIIQKGAQRYSSQHKVRQKTVLLVVETAKQKV